MLKTLLWKEWHEQRWRVALATVWLLGMTAIGLKTRILPDKAVVMMIWNPACILLPVFLGMGLFASERKERTLSYLIVHPVTRSQILAAKVIAGLLAYLTPFLIGGLTVCLTVGGREQSAADLAEGFAIMAALGLVFFIWQLFAGLRCRREETYILVSAVVLGCWALHGVVVDEWRLTENAGFWTWALNPFAIGELDYAKPSEVRTVVAVQSLILTGLGFGLWFRFRRLREGRS
ncbi:MAG: ABC transporter permease [Phycisphaerales bacterium]